MEAKKQILVDQINAVRRTGKVNMCDSIGVAKIAQRLGFKELQEFAKKDAYVDFIFTGNKNYLPE